MSHLTDLECGRGNSDNPVSELGHFAVAKRLLPVQNSAGFKLVRWGSIRSRGQSKKGGIVELPAAARLARFLFRQRVLGFPAPRDPHMDEETLRVFRALLEKADFYLEFGAGGSTVWADKLGVEALTVECDRFYASAVRRALSPTTKVDILIASIGLTGHWGEPVFRTPSPDRLARWRQYSIAPFSRIAARGRFPQLVLVDGRFRRACALQTAVCAAHAGAPVSILVDDYEGRAGYTMLEAYLGPAERHGRSALFSVPASGLQRMPDEKVLAEAAADYR